MEEVEILLPEDDEVEQFDFSKPKKTATVTIVKLLFVIFAAKIIQKIYLISPNYRQIRQGEGNFPGKMSEDEVQGVQKCLRVITICQKYNRHHLQTFFQKVCKKTPKKFYGKIPPGEFVCHLGYQ